MNNIPAEGTGAKETEEVWWKGEGCREQRRTEVKEKQRIPLYVRVIYKFIMYVWCILPSAGAIPDIYY